jgi:hypothetical protein
VPKYRWQPPVTEGGEQIFSNGLLVQVLQDARKARYQEEKSLRLFFIT